MKIRVYFLSVCFCYFSLKINAQLTDGPDFKNFESITGIKDAYPSISSDGKKVVFQSNRSGKWEIYTMDSSGKNIKQLTSGIEKSSTPVWSPDGSQIVFCKEINDNSEIYIKKSDGSIHTRLTDQPGYDSHPKFSPDGKYILFNSACTTPDLKVDWSKQWHEIFKIKPDGSEISQIRYFKTISTYPSISPDGKIICFRKVITEPGFNWDLSTTKRNSEVFVMNIDGIDAVNISNNSAYDRWPVWMPDSKIIYSSNRLGYANAAQLYMSNIDGSSTELVCAKKGALVQASDSSDGKKIYCHHNAEGPDFEYGGIVVITPEKK